jgi:hypothetical protein
VNAEETVAPARLNALAIAVLVGLIARLALVATSIGSARVAGVSMNSTGRHAIAGALLRISH